MAKFGKRTRRLGDEIKKTSEKKHQQQNITRSIAMDLSFIAVYNKYSRNVDLMRPGKIKNMIWDNFACIVSL